MRSLLILIILIFLGACSSSKSHSVLVMPKSPMDQLDTLERLAAIKKSSKGKLSPIRKEAIQDTAMTLGAQGGLAFRAKAINALLDMNTKTLDRSFNFTQLLLKNNVLPPILIEADNTVNIDNNDSIRLADKVYRIHAQARFASTVPNWRDYLLLNFSAPEPPHPTLLPKNAQERIIWKSYVQQGWKKGIEQAESIYSANLARLKRDYKGILLYRRLLTQNIVSPPFVAKANLGVTGGGNELRVNDKVLRITAMPRLNTDTKQWNPVLMENV